MYTKVSWYQSKKFLALLATILATFAAALTESGSLKQAGLVVLAGVCYILAEAIVDMKRAS